jgi:tripartite-type tricarboxylate transporter receptor subunit TctC
MRRLLIAFACLLSAACATGAAAQDYPTKPVRFVIGYAAGGGLDALARIVTDRLSKILPQRVVIENRAGAGGNIAVDLVANAPPDGYTMLFHDTAMLIAPAVYSKLSYDPLTSFTPVSQICLVTLVLATHPGVPAANTRELIALLRANPGKYSYASPGVGTVHHLAAESFKTMAGVDVVHVPYRGAAPAITDLIGGHIPLAIASAAAALPHAKSGKLKILGVTTAQRTPSAPEIPSLAEDLPGFDAGPTIFVLAPAGTPQPIVARMDHAIRAVLADKEVVDAYAAQGAVVAPAGPAELGRTIAAGVAKWAEVAKRSGAKLD